MRLIFAALLGFLSSVGCSDGDIDSPPGLIGPEGGRLSDASGQASVDVPPGAVSSPIQFSVTELPPDFPDAERLVTRVFDFQPDGTVFATPVVMEIRLTKTIDAGFRARLNWFDGQQWVVIPDSEDIDTVVRGQVSHFTPFAGLSEDVDECEENIDDCDPGTYCSNQAGGYSCSNCPPGYVDTHGDGSVCVELDECASGMDNCDELVECINIIGGFECGPCPSGYVGDGIECADVDECAAGTAVCDPMLPCLNTPGGYSCDGTCPDGYEDVHGDRSECVDIDECDIGTDRCDPLAGCTNMAGGYRCGACPPGYADVNGDRTLCEDIDECDGGLDNCDDLVSCTNTPGGFTCGACPSGYDDPNGDGTRCVEIDECLVDNGGCDRLTVCTNTLEEPTCGDCPIGYTGTGYIGCTDTDECLIDHGGCDWRVDCTNTPGGRTCEPCPEGYAGDGETGCIDLNPVVLQSRYLSSDPDAQALAAGGPPVLMPVDYYFDERGFSWRLINAMRMIGFEEPAVPWGEEFDKDALGILDSDLAAAEGVFEIQAAKFPFWSTSTTEAFVDNIPREYSAYMYATIFDLYNAGPSYQLYTYECLIAALVPAMCTPFQYSADGTGLACRWQPARTDPLVIDDHYIAGFTSSDGDFVLPEEYPPMGWVSHFMYIATVVHEMAHGLARYTTMSVSWEGIDRVVDYDLYNQTACSGAYMERGHLLTSPFRERVNYNPLNLSDHPSFYVSGYAQTGGSYEDHAETITAYMLLPEYFRERMRFSPKLRARYNFVRDMYFAGVQFHNPNILDDFDPEMVGDTKLYYRDRPDLTRFVMHEISTFVCGDSLVSPGEGCDDGNTVDGDGCDSTCQVDPCTYTTVAFDPTHTEARFSCGAGGRVGAITAGSCNDGFLLRVLEGVDDSEKVAQCVNSEGVTRSPSSVTGSCC